MKVKLLYIDVCILKVLAILLVVVSHYFRFFATESNMAKMKSIGFFGAALFSFLSGYLANINTRKILDERFNWLLKKVRTIYLPYILVNLISVFIVRSDENIYLQIFLGTNDSVLWYVPFIMAFFAIFYVILVKGLPSELLIIIGVISFVVLETFRLDSQWITSIGALILGVFASKLNIKSVKHLILYLVIFIISSVASIKFNCNYVVKDILIGLAGIGFCGLIYNVFMRIPSKELNAANIVSIINESTYWMYLMHMKVGIILDDIGTLSLFPYLFWSMIMAIVVNLIFKNLKIIRA